MKFHRPDQYSILRDVLRNAGYTDTGILGAIQAAEFPTLRGEDIPILLHRTAGNTPLNTLIRLFLLEVASDTDAVREAIRPMNPEDWAEAGLIRIHGNEVRAGIRLLPYGDLLIAFDRPSRLTTTLKRNYVMGIGGSSLTLANLTIRRHSRLTLDLGTGCGFHALLSAPHSDRVVALDINPRAIEFANFNAQLNSVPKIECLEGDLFEQLEGLQFDLIVSNPPFVISPETSYVYRDGGLPADELCRRIVQQAPQFLEEGGFCQMLCNWVEYDGENWQDRLRSWFTGTGCDAWVMRAESRDIATYAYSWIRHSERGEQGNTEERLKKWILYYEQLGISRISGGAIIMRRRSAPNWFSAENAPGKMTGPCGDSVWLGFRLRDFLQTADDQTLLRSQLTFNPIARLERVCVPSTVGWKDEETRLSMRTGLDYSGKIDPLAANFLIACDGTKSLDEVVRELSAAASIPAAELATALCTLTRNLIEHGFLIPN
jgi:SAM-dependent methyltransferase